MKPWQRTVFEKTRDRAFLLRFVLIMLAVSVMIGGMIHLWSTRKDLPRSHLMNLVMHTSAKEQQDYFVSVLNDHAPIKTVVEILTFLSHDLDDDPSPDEKALLSWRDEIRQLLDRSSMEPIPKELAVAYWDSLQSHTVTQNLLEIAKRKPRIPFVNELVGDLYRTERQYPMAAEYFALEGEFPASSEARKKELRILFQLKAIKKLESRSQNPLYEDEFDASARMNLGVLQHRWYDVARAIVPYQLEQLKPSLAALVGITACVWMLFCFQAIHRSSSIAWGSLLLCVVAIALGILSTSFTLFAIELEEELWKLKQTGNIGADLLYFIAGVGLREEACKLLLFLPLVPILMKRRSEVEILIVAACVGLGFAIEENLSYVQEGDPTTSLGRLLTANFFHMCTTGLIGLSLCQAIQRPRQGAEHFSIQFATLVVVHGLYDWLIANPPSDDFSFLNIVCFIWLAYKFFDELRLARGSVRDIVSMQATFILSTTFLLGVVFNYAVWFYGFRLGTHLVATHALALGVIFYMFLTKLEEI